MTVSQLAQDLRLVAVRRCEGAAFGKATAGRRVAQIGQASGNGREPTLFLAEPRDRRKQPLGIGVDRALEDVLSSSLLDDLPGIKHGHLVGDAPDHSEIVADEDHGQAALATQLLEQLEDLRLDRDVERRGRLVEDQQIRLGGEDAGDQGALAHAARQFVRVGLGNGLGLDDADLVEQLDCPREGALGREATMMNQPFANLVANTQRRIEHREGVLEDQADPRAAQAPTFLGVHDHDVLPVEQDTSGGDRRLLRQEAHRGERDRALARPGLADQSKRRAFPGLQRD